LTNQEIKTTFKYRAERNGNALSVQNNYGWYPIHIAAFHNLPIMIYMTKEAPATIIPEEQAKVVSVNHKSSMNHYYCFLYKNTAIS